MKKNILLLLAAVALLASCGRTHEEVVLSYPDGSPHIINIMKGKDDKAVRVGEKIFYANGQMLSERYFDSTDFVGTWQFFHPNGQRFAKANFDANHHMGRNWEFRDSAGNPLMEGEFDSVGLLAMPITAMPTTVGFYRGDSTFVMTFYDDFKLQGQGLLVKGQRQGLWCYYYPSGSLQAEAIFIDNIENGKHNVFRESGIPYYLGLFINGERAGTWEFYDEAGNLTGTKNFDS